MSPANMHFRFFGLWLTLVVAGLVGLWGGCRRKPPIPVAATLPATTQPSQAPPSQPASTQSASAPATAPASRPAALPPSTYDPRPPYTVRLYVRDPAQKQPGWLRIAELADKKSTATCQGVFPRRNRIEIETTNVRRLCVDVGFLPLAPGKRLILSIDGQTMELIRKNRRRVQLERGKTGAWHVAK